MFPIVALGRGLSAKEARSEARLQAIEKAVGAYVISEVTLRDGEFHEAITGFRAAVIEDLKVLQELEGDDGIWTSRVLAYVNTRPITAKMMGKGVIEGTKVNGVGLARASWARNRARKQFLDDAESALAGILDGFPEAFLRLVPDGDLEVTELPGSESAHLRLPYRLDVDFEGYQERMLPVLHRFFAEVGSVADVAASNGNMLDVLSLGLLSSGSEFNGHFRHGRNSGERLVQWSPAERSRLGDIQHGWWGGHEDRKGKSTVDAPFLILVATDYDTRVWGTPIQLNFRGFALDNELGQRLSAVLQERLGPSSEGSLVVGLNAVTRAGEVVGQESVRLNYCALLSDRNMMLLTPFPSISKGIDHYSAHDLKFVFEFDLDYSAFERMSQLQPTVSLN